MAEEKAVNASVETKPTCFVIMPFTDPDGYEKGHFRKIYDQLFVPAIERAGYIPHRVDDEIQSTMIHGKLLDQLITAPMVLCDLSSRNPNVLYELGIRHAFDMPVVLVQEEGTPRIFDISGLTAHDYRKARLYDEVIEDQLTITKAIQETAKAKNHSIMSLVKLTPAVLKNTEAITAEDRIMLEITDLKDAMTRLSRIVEREHIKTVRFSSRRYNTQSLEDAISTTLLKAMTMQVDIQSGVAPQTSEIEKMINNLQNTIIDCQRENYPANAKIEEMKNILIYLQGHLHKK